MDRQNSELFLRVHCAIYTYYNMAAETLNNDVIVTLSIEQLLQSFYVAYPSEK